LKDLLKRHFGHDSFLPLQEEIVMSVVAGHDSLVLMPTGGGKSLCYQLPAMAMDGVTLVVSPLIALMKDQVDALRANGIDAGYVNSTLSLAEISRVQRQAFSGELRLLYVAPERIATSAFRRFLHSMNLSLIAVDEAHCISEWGHEFRPDYRNLSDLRGLFPDVPLIALTATATERVRKDIRDQLDLREPRVFVASFDRPNLRYSVHSKIDRYRRLTGYLGKHQDRSTIIYRSTRRGTEDLASTLTADGFRAMPYHAGLEGDRAATQDRFIKDQVPIVVATVAFGMGIDKPDIRLVVHYDLPSSIEQYYQETGRAGRDGLPADCVLFYSPGDRVQQEYFIDRMESETERRGARNRLDAIVEYAELATCRRARLLGYLGETLDRDGCGACDVCDPVQTASFNGTVIAQKILSAVIRTGERFGAAHVAKVLRGANTKQIRQYGHERLSVYDIVDDYSESQLLEVMSLLVGRGLLVRGGQYPTLSVTGEGREALRPSASVSLPMLETATMDTGPDAPATEYDAFLFEKLRSLRLRLAGERGVPPYVVFGDASLQQMARYYPQSNETFLKVSGVGESKLQQFGAAFLTVIRDHAGPNGREDLLEGRVESGPSAGRKDRKGSSGGIGNSVKETRGLLLQGMPLDEIARSRGFAVRTVVGHVVSLIESGDVSPAEYLVPTGDRLDKIRDAFRVHGYYELSPVREALGHDYSYDELQIARAYLRSSHEDA
jgi:ATP-dependent DNA helicase RecQ